MDHNETSSFTPFDYMTQTRELQMLKTMLPYLKVYASLLTLTKHPNEPSAKVEMPPCSEEIAIADDNVYVLFESASLRYFEGTDGKGNSRSPIDKVLEVTVASIW